MSCPLQKRIHALLLVLLPYRCGQTEWRNVIPRDPLFAAAATGQVAQVQAVLAGGGDVPSRDLGDETPLHEAVAASNPDVVTRLLAHDTAPLLWQTLPADQPMEETLPGMGWDDHAVSWPLFRAAQQGTQGTFAAERLWQAAHTQDRRQMLLDESIPIGSAQRSLLDGCPRKSILETGTDVSPRSRGRSGAQP